MDFRAVITLPYLLRQLFSVKRFIDLGHKGKNKNKLQVSFSLLALVKRLNRKKWGGNYVKYGLFKRSSH